STGDLDELADDAGGEDVAGGPRRIESDHSADSDARPIAERQLVDANRSFPLDANVAGRGCCGRRDLCVYDGERRAEPNVWRRRAGRPAGGGTARVLSRRPLTRFS